MIQDGVGVLGGGPDGLAEFFNLFNRANFGIPGATVGTSTAGLITGTAATARDIQFGLKLTF